MATSKKAGKSKALPGAHKPRQQAPPSNEAIIKAAARDGEATLVRPRTTNWAEDADCQDMLRTAHVYGEIVDDTVMRELKFLNAKERVCWANPTPTSPSCVSYDTQHFVDGDLTHSPAFLQQRQHQQLVMQTPPTVKRGTHHKCRSSDGDRTPQYDGDQTPQSASSPGIVARSTYVHSGLDRDASGVNTPSYAASPSNSPAPSTACYSSSTAASRKCLIEEAKARQLFSSQMPSNAVATTKTVARNISTPHMRPTGPGVWPDMDEQKAVAAEKRIQYKEELDLQVSAKKPQDAVGSQASPGSAVQSISPLKPAKKPCMPRHGGSQQFEACEIEHAILLDSVSKRELQDKYKAELDQQVQEKRAQTAAAGTKAAGVWVSRRVRGRDLSQSSSPLKGESASPLSTPAWMPAYSQTPELKVTASKIATMHWGERDVEAWHALERKRLDYRADLLAQIEAKKEKATAQKQVMNATTASATIVASTNASSVSVSPRVLSEPLTAAPINDHDDCTKLDIDMVGKEPLLSSATGSDDVIDSDLQTLYGMPYTEPGMTDFGLTRSLEEWERPKGIAAWESARERNDDESDVDYSTPRYDGLSSATKEESMPAYVKTYLGDVNVDEETRQNDGENCRKGEAARIHFGQVPRGGRCDTPDTQLSAASCSTRASTRPKIAFGRRVTEPKLLRAGSRAASIASTNLSLSSSRTSSTKRVPSLSMARVHGN